MSLNHDPLDVWAETMKAEIDQYVATFKDSNDFHKRNNTWSEWVNSFIGYMSW
jgi:hypothetical protein